MPVCGTRYIYSLHTNLIGETYLVRAQAKRTCVSIKPRVLWYPHTQSDEKHAVQHRFKVSL